MKNLVLPCLIGLILWANISNAQVKTAAEQTNLYLPLLKGKKVALVVNNSSCIGQIHLIDSLLSLKIKVAKIFAPEHGLKGNVSAGDKVSNEVYGKSKIPVISLYGEKKKPTTEDLKGIEVVVFDIQDAGVRFFTYISTMSYVMEACAENNIPLIVLDRPNPNGYYVDGPVLKKEFASFVGLHPVPVVYGMTIGEYAKMVNGEGWLKNQILCDLKVIPLSNYRREEIYIPVQALSPNLRTREAILLYPSLCFFEGTPISVGRGTEYPFEVIGFPGFRQGSFSFTPVSVQGVSENPPYMNKECTGFHLHDFAEEFIPAFRGLYLFWLKDFYDAYEEKDKFFNPFFDKLAGTDELRKQIISGMEVDMIRKSWELDIIKFLEIRKKYLIYPDIQASSVPVPLQIQQR